MVTVELCNARLKSRQQPPDKNDTGRWRHVMTKAKRVDQFGELYAEYRAAVDAGSCPVVWLEEQTWMHPVRMSQFKKYIGIVERGPVKGPQRK